MSAADTPNRPNAPRPLSVAVLISGTGSNLRAILDAIAAGRCAARIAGVLSDKPSAPGLALAQRAACPAHVVRPRDYPDRASWDAALAEAVGALSPDLVVLAGFMRIVGAPLLARFPRRILNVHPSLLPAFPGVDAPSQAIAAGVRLSGCTVHLVDRGVDTGPIVAQAAVPVLPEDDAAGLHARIQRLEHHLLPAVIDGVARGQITLSPAVAYAGRLGTAPQVALVSPQLDVEPHPEVGAGSAGQLSSGSQP